MLFRLGCTTVDFVVRRQLCVISERIPGELVLFPDSYSDDLLFFRSVRERVRLTTCPEAGVLYRIHPKAESSLNTKAWWAFNQLLPSYDAGVRQLPEINAIAKDFAVNGVV